MRLSTRIIRWCSHGSWVADTNDKFIKVLFSFARSFADTQKADSMEVVLDQWRNTQTVRNSLSEKLNAAGLQVEIKTWQQLSVFYKNVRNMFDMIFLFIFVIVFMSTTNTMGMAVVERIRETGTLRVLGLKKRGVSFLFAAEGMLPGLAGSIAGLVIHTLAWAAISWA